MSLADPIEYPRPSEPPPLWTVEEPDLAREGHDGRDLPILATAIHDGHALDPKVAGAVALSEEVRLREEDPGTALFTELGLRRVIVHRSRFEVDLNRPRDGAVYATPDDAWGLEVWSGGEAPPEALALGRGRHDDFYAAMETLLADMEARWGCFAVYDVHSYNHRRNGPDEPAEPREENPEINVGTGALGEEGRERWALVVDRFLDELRACEVLGRTLDVRENVKFRGGHFPRWIARTFPRSACPLAIEIKKIYMDEWSGEVDHDVVRELRRALATTLTGVADALADLGCGRRAWSGGE